MLDTVSSMLNVIFLPLLKLKCLKGKEKMKAETMLILREENVVEGSIHLSHNFSEIIFSFALPLVLSTAHFFPSNKTL